jgi:hypothetical protein
MKTWVLLVSVILIMSSSMAVAWGPTDPTDSKADPDNDKLGNLDEFRAGSNPLNPDTDGGGAWDGWEVTYGLDPTNPADDEFDTDGDYWSNYREFLEGTNPLKPNTDDDDYPIDSTDPDPLKPNFKDWRDIGPPFKLPTPPELDSDNDTIPDVLEPRIGTDPFNKDSDGDGLHDGLEVAHGTDPNDRDTDDDSLLDGQEVRKFKEDEFFTGTNPRKADSDGDGIGDYVDDEDNDGIHNGGEWKYEPLTREPSDWLNPRSGDTDGDRVGDKVEIDGNPRNDDQTSDPTEADTDGDRLTDDIDPHTWVFDILPYSRIGYNDTHNDPLFPMVVEKGVPFNIEGRVEYNSTTLDNPLETTWMPITGTMTVQVWVLQDGEMVPISDSVVTGNDGKFKVSCTVGDGVKAGLTTLVITTNIHQRVNYLPMVWDEIDGNHLP